MAHCVRLATPALVIFTMKAASAQQFTEVWLDPAAGAVQSALPFDRPFVLAGKATPELQRVTVRIEPGAVTSCKDSTKAYEWLHGVIPPAAKDTFRVLVSEPLKANHRYTVCLSVHGKLPQETLTRFMDAARNLIDQVVREVHAKGSLSINDSLANRVKALLETEAGAGVSIKNKDGGKPITLEWLSPIADALDKRRAAANSVQDDADRAVTALEALRTNPVFAVLMSQGTFAASDVAVRDVFFSLAMAPASMLSQVATGQVVLGKPDETPVTRDVPAAELWDTVTAAQRVAALGSTESQLLAGRLFLSRLAVDTTLQKTMGLREKVTEAGVTALQQVIGTAVLRLDTSRRDFADLKAALVAEDLATRAQVDRLVYRVANESDLVASTNSQLSTRAGWYVAADFGVAYVPTFGDVHPYAGVNFYLRPVDKQVPISQLPYQGLEKMLRVCSPMIGVTLKGVSKAGERDDLVFGQALLMGAGCRFSDALRASIGTMLFQAQDTNRLSADKHLAGSIFFSASFDYDVKSSLGKIGDLLF